MLVALLSARAFADTSGEATHNAPFLLHLTPALIIPVGSDASDMSPGGLLTLAGEFFPTIRSRLSVLGELGYALNRYNDETLSFVSAGGGLRIGFTPTPRLRLHGAVTGGYLVGLLPVAGLFVPVSRGYVSAAAGGRYHLNSRLDLGISSGYRNLFGFYGGVWVSAGVALRVGDREEKESVTVEPAVVSEPVQEAGPEEGQLRLDRVSFFKVFPVFYSYYADHSIGEATLRNTSQAPITDIEVSIFVSRYMDAPADSVRIDKLAAGEERRIEFTALFTERMLEITEGTKVAAEITLEYSAEGGKRHSDEIVEHIDIEYRNAMMWDDDRKAAAFVTAKDPRVLAFSKNVAGMITGTELQIHKNLGTAIALYETLRLYGMSYVIDPSTPYEQLSANALQVDYLQFPRESLEYKAGDCDDLSILYSALLESVGIETAFITFPGHIYMAFSVDMDPLEGRKRFSRADELIFRNERTWIPVEITALEGSFLDAWQQGAKQWREHLAREQAGFYPMADAWQSYRPVGLPGTAGSVAIPERDAVLRAYGEQVEEFINLQIYESEAVLRRQIRESNNAARWVNKLGVLYARYGLYERAVREFEKILESEDYVPAMLNIGNIHLQRQELQQAHRQFDRALQITPNDPNALLAVAQVNHELENYGTVQEVYQKLKNTDSKLAEQFAYLDMRGEEAVRAAQISGIDEMVLWVEEE